MIKKNSLPFFVFFVTLLVACQKNEEEPILESSIEFTFSNEEELYQSISDPSGLNGRGIIAIPLSESSESRIVSYIKFNNFYLNDDPNVYINVQLHYTIDIVNGIPNLDSLFLKSTLDNDAVYIIDQLNHMDFGVALDFQDVDGTDWYSYNSPTTTMNINQNGSMFDIYEVLELTDGIFIKAKFNCNLFNELGETLKIESGTLVFRLQ